MQHAVGVRGNTEDFPTPLFNLVYNDASYVIPTSGDKTIFYLVLICDFLTVLQCIKEDLSLILFLTHSFYGDGFVVLTVRPHRLLVPAQHHSLQKFQRKI